MNLPTIVPTAVKILYVMFLTTIFVLPSVPPSRRRTQIGKPQRSPCPASRSPNAAFDLPGDKKTQTGVSRSGSKGCGTASYVT